jgi:vitamin B12 transporter
LILIKKRYFFVYFACFCHSFLAQAQKDSLRNLPSLEVASFRINRFTLGQVQLETDSLTLRLLQQQPLQDWLMTATPLSFRTYGTGVGSVSSRGTGANHTALLWNGINIQNTLNGIVDLPTIELGTSKISLKMGANTALFGSGAMGATILMDDIKTQQNGLQSSLNIGAGSFDYQQLASAFRYKKGKFAGETRLSKQQSKNDFPFKNITVLGQPIQKAINADFEHFNLTQHFYLDIKENQFLKVHFWHSQNKRSVTPTMTARNDNAVLRDTMTRGLIEWSLYKGTTIVKARVAAMDDNNNFKSKAVKNSQNRIQRIVNEVEINKEISTSYSFRLSGNYTREQSLSNNFAENYVRNRIALLGNQLFQKEKFGQVAINIREEIIDGKAAPFTFSVGANAPIVKQKYELRGSLSRVYNLPSLNDLYWKKGGNPALLPERGWSKEFGVSRKMKNAHQQCAAHLTFFQVNLNTQLAWLPSDDGVFRPVNLSEMRSTGIETMLDYHVAKGVWIFGVSPQYQLAQALSKDKKQQIFVPRHNGNISFSVRYKNAMLLWSQAASSRRYMATDNSSWVNGFTVGNCSFVFSPKVKKTTMNFTLKILNVLDADYQILAEYANPKRNFKIDYTLNF